jgi:hypothetical protein
MTRCYKKGFNAFWKVNVNNKEENTYIQGGVKKYKFKETHPVLKFSHLIQLKFPSIPRIALPKGKLCPLNELEQKCTNPPHHVVGKREVYAKIALLMFYPLQQGPPACGPVQILLPAPPPRRQKRGRYRLCAERQGHRSGGSGDGGGSGYGCFHQNKPHPIPGEKDNKGKMLAISAGKRTASTVGATITGSSTTPI